MQARKIGVTDLRRRRGLSAGINSPPKIGRAAPGADPSAAVESDERKAESSIIRAHSLAALTENGVHRFSGCWFRIGLGVKSLVHQQKESMHCLTQFCEGVGRGSVSAA